MEERLQELVDSLHKAGQICLELKIENSDNLDWYHFDAAWEAIGKAIEKLKIVQGNSVNESNP